MKGIDEAVRMVQADDAGAEAQVRAKADTSGLFAPPGATMTITDLVCFLVAGSVLLHSH